MAYFTIHIQGSMLLPTSVFHESKATSPPPPTSVCMSANISAMAICPTPPNAPCATNITKTQTPVYFQQMLNHNTKQTQRSAVPLPSTNPHFPSSTSGRTIFPTFCTTIHNNTVIPREVGVRFSRPNNSQIFFLRT